MRRYLQRHARHTTHLPFPPGRAPDIIVVIPAYDEPDILRAVESLAACRRGGMYIEIIVVINHPINTPAQVKATNLATLDILNQWATSNNSNDFKLFALPLFDLPTKDRGVGHARKTGMDEAIYRYEMVDHPSGIIAAFDADATCAPDYLKAIREGFESHPNADALTIYFEHPLAGTDYPVEIYHAIYEYELHLRYYVQGVRWAGHPQGWHTVGSSMAVRASAYAAMGGMNRRQAGEDFYFLHKFSAVGRLYPLNSTAVYPSPRISDKVPFGTGRAIGDMMRTGKTMDTYHPEAFEVLKHWLEQAERYFDDPESVNVPASMASFLEHTSFEEKCRKLRQNTASRAVFTRRFFQVFDAFFIMKWLHFFRDNHMPNVPVRQAAARLLQWQDIPVEQGSDLLKVYRALDKNRTK